jgi:hypothetical protein
VSAMTGIPAEDVDRRAGLLMAPTEAFLRYWLSRHGTQLRQEEVLEAWYHRAPSVPQLYLYSDADPLVPVSEVEQYMKLQQTRGVEVTGHMFRGSGHCQHLRMHPHQYALQVSKFVTNVLSSWN